MDISANTAAGNAENNDSIQKQRETFVASLSHDLKNPTIAQIRAIELILKGKFGQILPEQREVMEMVLDSCKYMNAMLGSVLTTYRNESGIVKLVSEEVSIADLAVECIDEMIYLAKDRKILVNFYNTAEKEIVWGDKVQLRRVIMNFLSNGIKYAYNNTEIRVDVYNEKQFTCFRYENQSPYMSQEKQKKIFAKYVSYSQKYMLNGVGLGLYASKKIVEAHGGKIFVHSFKENKNIFGFKIPNNENLKNSQRSIIF